MAVLVILLLVLFLSDHVFFYVDKDEVSVSVKEGNSVTLHTGVKAYHLEDIKWYFNDMRIAEISGDLSDICTDVQCEYGDERFRDRLMLDHQTGSLTIMNTRNTDSGEYQLKLISNVITEKIFSVTVHGVTATEHDKKSVKEGESVTLEPEVVRNPKEVMKWYFNDILIAEIIGFDVQICEDAQCKERFRGRLKLDQTGSLTITDIRKKDSGLYEFKRSSSSSRRINSADSPKRFSVTVNSGPSIAGISAAVVLLVAAAVVI